MKHFAFMGFLAVAASSQAILIDDFTTGSATTGFQDAIGSYSSLTPAVGALGGDRYLQMDITANPLQGAARARTQASFGVFSVSSEADVDTAITLGYGYASVAGPAGSDPLNIDFSSNPLVKLVFRSNDITLPTTVKLITNGGASSFSRSLNVSGGIVPASPTTFTFDFTADAASLSDVDGIVLSFDTAPDGDFAVTNISAVPEPASMAAITVGIAAMLRRRRK